MRPSLSSLSHTPPRAILRGEWGLAESEAGSGRWLGGREGVGLRRNGVPPRARALRRSRPGRPSRAVLPSFLTGPAARRCIPVSVVPTPPGPGPGSRGLASRFLLWRGKWQLARRGGKSGEISGRAWSPMQRVRGADGTRHGSLSQA